jgi:hypothetical protein
LSAPPRRFSTTILVAVGYRHDNTGTRGQNLDGRADERGGEALTALEQHLRRQTTQSRDFFWHRVRWEAVKGQLRGKRFTVTDVGAGIGLIGEFMSHEFPDARYRFVEPLASLAAELEARFGGEANANDAAGYHDSQFITLLDVLEHIENDRAFLHELSDKMTPGATLIMTVPALQGLWSQWDVALGHHRRYDKRMIEAVFDRLALQPREVSYLFPEMVPPALLRRIRSSGRSGSTTNSADFPDVSARLNEVLYRVGRRTLALRRLWPMGTSLLVVADRT